MKKILLGVVLAVLLVPTVSGIEWVSECLNETHLYQYYDEWSSINGDVQHIAGNRTIECNTSCMNNQCISYTTVPPELYTTAPLALAIIAFLFAYLSTSISRKHGSLQLLFLALSFMMVLFVSWMVSSMIVMPIMIWSFVLVVFYVIIFFIYQIFSHFGVVGRKEEED